MAEARFNAFTIELTDFKNIPEDKRFAIPLSDPNARKAIEDCFADAFRKEIVLPEPIRSTLALLKIRLIEDNTIAVPHIRKLVLHLKTALVDFDQVPIVIELINQYLKDHDFISFHANIFGSEGPYQHGFRFFNQHANVLKQYTQKFKAIIDEKIRVEAKRTDNEVKEKQGKWNKSLEKLIMSQYKDDQTLVSIAFAMLGYLQNQWQEKVELVVHSNANIQNKNKISLESLFEIASKDIENLFELIKGIIAIKVSSEQEKEFIKKMFMEFFPAIQSYPGVSVHTISSDLATKLHQASYDMNDKPHFSKQLDALRKKCLDIAVKSFATKKNLQNEQSKRLA